MSQQDLAVAMGMSMPAVTQWETERIHPRRTTARKLDDILGAGGEIMNALGYLTEEADPVSQLRRVVAQQGRAIEELIRVVNGLLGDGAVLIEVPEDGGSA
jgi:transcriptional regulator with XRE-family HTH domain